MKYHDEINSAVLFAEEGVLTEEGFRLELEKIEKKYIDRCEPDGDLQYALSIALEKVIKG